MQTGIKGARIAIIGGDEAEPVRKALSDAGATVELLSAGSAEGSRWHSATYAALVATSSLQGGEADKALQLVREFLVADKPVAAHGDGVNLLLSSGGLAGRSVAVDDELTPLASAAGATTSQDAVHVDEAVITSRASTDAAAFAKRVVQHLGRRMEERQVDEMSELSFPASDPPAVSPSSIGPAPDRAQSDKDAR
jgi:putative intracellular protease/amidase